jgi:hypothetical protein
MLFIIGIVNAPVESTFATEFPEIVPKSDEATIETLYQVAFNIDLIV